MQYPTNAVLGRLCEILISIGGFVGSQFERDRIFPKIFRRDFFVIKQA
jgi:hypothetical protein